MNDFVPKKSQACPHIPEFILEYADPVRFFSDIVNDPERSFNERFKCAKELAKYRVPVPRPAIQPFSANIGGRLIRADEIPRDPKFLQERLGLIIEEILNGRIPLEQGKTLAKIVTDACRESNNLEVNELLGQMRTLVGEKGESETEIVIREIK